MSDRNVSLLLTGGTVVTMNPAREVFADGAVAIDGPKIVAVGPKRELSRLFRADRVIDVGGSVVLPGLVNTHTHAFQNLYKGLGDDMPVLDWVAKMIFPLSRHLGGDEAFVGAQLACLEMIKGGVTSFSDSFYIHRDPDAIYRVAQAVEQAGLRAVLGRASVDQGVPDDFREPAATAIQRTEEAVRNVSGLGEGRIQVCPEALFTLFCSPELVAGLRAIAGSHGVQFHMHAGESIVEANQIRQETGKTIFAYLESLDALGPDVLIAHAVWCTETDIRILSERQTAVAHNPVSNQYLASGVAPVVRMRQQGVTVGLGTDGAASNNSQDLFETMKAACLLQKVNSLDAEVLTAPEALEMATANGARAMGLEDQTGSLVPGKKADVVTVRVADPHTAPALKPVSTLVYCARASDVQTVIVDGRILMEDRRVLVMDEEDVIARGREVARGIVAAAGKEELLDEGFLVRT